MMSVVPQTWLAVGAVAAGTSYVPTALPTRLRPTSELGLQVWSEPEAHNLSIARLDERSIPQTADTRFPCGTQGPKLPMVTKTRPFQKAAKEVPPKSSRPSHEPLNLTAPAFSGEEAENDPCLHLCEAPPPSLSP